MVEDLKGRYLFRGHRRREKGHINMNFNVDLTGSRYDLIAVLCESDDEHLGFIIF
jgi:hypothetical protein